MTGRQNHEGGHQGVDRRLAGLDSSQFQPHGAKARLGKLVDGELVLLKTEGVGRGIFSGNSLRPFPQS